MTIEEFKFKWENNKFSGEFPDAVTWLIDRAEWLERERDRQTVALANKSASIEGLMERWKEAEKLAGSIERETATRCAELAEDTEEHSEQDGDRHWITHRWYGANSAEAIRREFSL